MNIKPSCYVTKTITPLLQLKSVDIYVSVYNPHPDLTQMSLHTN